MMQQDIPSSPEAVNPAPGRVTIARSLAEAVERNYVPVLHSFYGHTMSTYDMDYHAHARIEIMYAVTGRCRIPVRLPDGQEQEWILREGEFILIDAWVYHRLVITPDHPCRLYMLEILALDRAGEPRLGHLAVRSPMLAMLARKARPCIRLTDHGAVYQAISRLQQECENHMDKPDHAAMLSALFTCLFLELSRCHDQSRLRSGYGHVQKAMRYIQAHFDQELTVRSVADTIGLHPAHLERLFHEHRGQGIHACMLQLRLEKACMLLLNSNLTIIDIAVSTGFNSRQNFSLAFRRRFGLPPREYRLNRGNQAIGPGERVLEA